MPLVGLRLPPFYLIRLNGQQCTKSYSLKVLHLPFFYVALMIVCSFSAALCMYSNASILSSKQLVNRNTCTSFETRMAHPISPFSEKEPSTSTKIVQQALNRRRLSTQVLRDHMSGVTLLINQILPSSIFLLRLLSLDGFRCEWRFVVPMYLSIHSYSENNVEDHILCAYRYF